MSITVPFVGQLLAGEQSKWLEALSVELPGMNIVPVAELPDRRGHRVAVVANPNPADLETLTDLVWVQSLWAGVEKLLAEPALAPVGIARLIDPCLANTMAEAVLAWTLYLHRDMPTYRTQQVARTWQQLSYMAAADRRVAILGLGELGRAAAHRLSLNGFDVMGWSRSLKTLEGVRSFHGERGLMDMLSESDILVCLLPLTDATRGLLGKVQLAKLPKSAALINFGRGPILDTTALMTALEEGQLRHAVLDVFDEEPLPETSPLWAHPSITVLPHISAPTSIKSAARIAARNIKAFHKDGTLPPFVDRERGY